MTEEALCRNKLHPVTPENRRPKSNGLTQCRPCHRAASARYGASELRRLTRRDADRRYNYSTAGMLRLLRRDTKRAGA